MSKILFEPREGLLQKIIERVHYEQRVLAVRNKIIIFSLIMVLSTALLIFVSESLVSDFASSGFEQFFSLLFSDFSAVLPYWQSFIFALLESLPAVSLAFFLALLLLFLQSLKSLALNIKIIRNNKLLIN
jgi:ABC-type spermidine/putrescine transport system permease subunit I